MTNFHTFSKNSWNCWSHFFSHGLIFEGFSTWVFPHGPCENLISTWPMKKSFINSCYLTNFLPMRKSDFHMTHENFFIPWVENPSKISPWEKILPPMGLQLLGGKIFHPQSNFGGIFNPGDEEISIPDNQSIRKSYISHLVWCPSWSKNLGWYLYSIIYILYN